MIQKITEIAVPVLFLGIGSIRDIRTGRIRVRWLLFAAMIFGILALVVQQRDAAGLMLSLLPGSCLLLLGFITREQIGYGDGAAVLILGLVMQAELLLRLLLTASLLLSAVGLFLLIGKKLQRSSRIPYLPFLLAGMVINSMMP